MAENSKIEWCDATANFWHGCFKVSPGCKNCYAETLSKRYGHEIWGPPATTTRLRVKSIWKDIHRWDKEASNAGVRRRVFVSSMSDFLEDHPQVIEWRKEAIRILENLRWLDVLLLTKRPENAKRFLEDWFDAWPDHVWFGVSAENQGEANRRIPELLKVPAPIKFLSIEPMLERINLGYAHPCGYYCDEAVGHVDHHFWTPNINTAVKWVICGGESGPHYRPFDIKWAHDLRDQCRAANVPFFIKQIGGHPYKRDKLSDFPEDLRIREFPN